MIGKREKTAIHAIVEYLKLIENLRSIDHNPKEHALPGGRNEYFREKHKEAQRLWQNVIDATKRLQ